MTILTTPDPALTLCFTGNRNHPNKKADFTGAFLPEMRSFMKLWGIDKAKNHLMVDLDAAEISKKRSVYNFIERRATEEGKAPTALVFSCHGFTNRIELGLRGATGAKEFAKFLRAQHVKHGTPGQTALTVILYCCSTGGGAGEGGDGGFADKLRDSLCEEGFVDCRVVGSETAGHATMNSRKRVFDGMGSPVGGTGGSWVVQPGTALFKKWQKAMTANSVKLPVAKDFRFQFPFMSIASIHKWLIANVA
ncbi:MAG: hypothetical protein WC761_00365 [Candidatus Paceibacterota bacterium]|jgi:hypothetical protein